MQFSASPLGQLHQTLTDKYKGKCKPDKNLDDCELRADSQDSKDLRVKTGRLWGLSPKERNTHRLFAFPVVSKAFFSSVHSLVTDQKNLDPSVQSKTKGEAAGVWTSYVVPLRALTLGDLPRLYDRAVQLVKDNQLMNANTQPIIESDFLTPQRDPKAPTLPSSSSSSSSSTLASSSSSSSASLSSPTAAALAALKAAYPAEEFSAEQGSNDAASLQMRREFFHAKLDALVQIAVGCQPMLLGSVAAGDGYSVLKRAAERMKREPDLQPAVALYQETIDATLAQIAASYQAQAQECPQSAKCGK